MVNSYSRSGRLDHWPLYGDTAGSAGPVTERCPTVKVPLRLARSVGAAFGALCVCACVCACLPPGSRSPCRATWPPLLSMESGLVKALRASPPLLTPPTSQRKHAETERIRACDGGGGGATEERRWKGRGEGAYGSPPPHRNGTAALPLRPELLFPWEKDDMLPG